MRSFIITICTFLAACLFAGCVSGGNDCANGAVTKDCTGDDDTAPDGGVTGDDSHVPTSDCGDGFCEADKGETTGTCGMDCNDQCVADGGEYSVYCEQDGNCNAPGTDCNMPMLPSCGNAVARCEAGETATCCQKPDGLMEYYFCPDPELSIYCADTSACVADRSDCPNVILCDLPQPTCPSS